MTNPDAMAEVREKIAKPPVLALNQTITWARKFKNRKMFRREQIVELIIQFMEDQRNADRDYFLKAIPLISAEARKQERERIVEYLGNDRGFGLVKKVQALKEGGKEAERWKK